MFNEAYFSTISVLCFSLELTHILGQRVLFFSSSERVEFLGKIFWIRFEFFLTFAWLLQAELGAKYLNSMKHASFLKFCTFFLEFWRFFLNWRVFFLNSAVFFCRMFYFMSFLEFFMFETEFFAKSYVFFESNILKETQIFGSFRRLLFPNSSRIRHDFVPNPHFWTNESSFFLHFWVILSAKHSTFRKIYPSYIILENTIQLL